MISTQVYSAYLIGSPDRQLSILGGRLSVDDTRAPHVEGDLDLAWPGHWELVADAPPVYGGLVWHDDPELLAALDPKLTPRVRVEIDGEYPSFSVHREFDLGIRRRVPNQVTRVVALQLASDEALLADVRALEDDTTPRTHQASLRAVVDYVLGTAIAGADLAAAPAIDADVTAYWQLTNLHPNPDVDTGISGYLTGSAATTLAHHAGTGVGGTSGYLLASQTGAGGAVYLTGGATAGHACTEGESFVVAINARASHAGMTSFVTLRWFNADGGVIRNDSGTPTALPIGTNWVRFHHIAKAPPGAVKLVPYAQVAGAASGRQWAIDRVLIAKDTELVDWFDGNHPPAGYTTHWEDAANASASTRVPIVERSRESLTWKAGKSALEFLAPLIQSVGYRLVCDETRSWTLRNENYEAEGGLSISYGVNMIEGSDEIDRGRGLWFDAQVTRYLDGVDSFALNDPPTRVNEVVIDAAYPGPGRSEYAVRRAQGRGRQVDATAVARWTERAEQFIVIELDGAPIQIGKTSSVTWDLGPGSSRDRVSVTTRTTDTPPSAWVLIPDADRWVDAPPAETWTGEVI